MDGEIDQTLKRLKELTKTNLSKSFEHLNDFCASSINHAHRCDLNLVLKDIAFAELAAHRLREDADRRYFDGKITLEEYKEISDLSTSLIFEKLSKEVSNAIVYSCGCVKSGSLSEN
jgi:hypothetical protein